MRALLHRFADILARRVFTAAALLLAIVVGFGSGLSRLEMDSSSTGLIAASDPAAAAYDDIKATFGDDVAFTVIYRSKALFTVDVLASLDDMSFALEDLDGVTRVVSLSTVSDLRGEGDVLNTNQLMAFLPESDAEAEEIGERARANELLVGEVVGRGGETAALHAFIEARPEDKDFQRRTLTAIQALIDREKARLGEETHIYVSGGPLVGVAIVDNMLADAKILAPLSIVAVGVVLLFFFQAAIVLVLPFVTGVASVSATLGFMGLVGFEINPLSVIIPSLLLVVGATEDIHLLSEYASALGKNQDKRQAIRSMLRVSGLAIVLTSLTTTIGFLTLAPHDIPLIAEFGVAAAFGMTINFIITVLATPLVARLMPAPKRFERPESRLLTPLRRWLADAVLRRRQWIVVGSLAFLGVSGALASQVVVDNDFLAFFKQDAEIRKTLAAQAEDISGASILLVEADTHRPGGLEDPATLKEIAKLTDFLKSRHGDVLSYDLFIRKTHMEMNGGDPPFFVVPDDPGLISQYTLLIAPETLSRFADFDMARAVILTRTKLAGSGAMMAELPTLEAFVAEEISPNVTVRFSGEAVLVAQSADTMSREIVTNLGYVFAAIFVLLSLLFSSVRAGLLSLAPNLLPIVGVFGAMGLLDIPLGTSVFPVAVIALGIAVDDTIHFMARYSTELRHTDANEAAIRATIDHELRPVISSSAALIAGFGVLTLAEFGSIQQFGVLAAIAMLLAVLADLVVTPALLVTTPIISAWDLLSARLDPAFARESDLLRDLKPSELRRVAASAQIESYEAGDRLLAEGDVGRDMLLIVEGAAEVTASDGRQIGKVEKGAIVGELAFLTNAPRAATVAATEPVEALKISAATLDRIRRRYPRIAAKLYHNIALVLTERLATAQK